MQSTPGQILGRQRWNPARPRILVVACSDGRLQENLDELVEKLLGVRHCDRFYVPGGPGALASSGLDLLRSHQHQTELEFLITHHKIEEVIFVFHGPAADGPPEACCADYCRKLLRSSPDEIRRQQDRDAAEIKSHGLRTTASMRLRFYRCEVRRDGLIQFVPLSV